MIALAGLEGEERRFWPWEVEPYRLWSLLDMARFDCRALVNAVRYVQKVRLDYQGGRESSSTLIQAMANLHRACSELPYPRALMDELHRVAYPGFSGQSAPPEIALIESLERQALGHLENIGFFAVDPDRTDFYGEKGRAWFSLPSRQKFSAAEHDMRDACQCYALDQWTASVFHSMRVLEIVFRALARHLQVTFQHDLEYADWKTLQDQVNSRIATLHKQGRGKTKAEDLEFFTACATELDHFGWAWRHGVCHARTRHDAQSAREVLDRTRKFVDRLAARL